MQSSNLAFESHTVGYQGICVFNNNINENGNLIFPDGPDICKSKM